MISAGETAAAQKALIRARSEDQFRLRVVPRAAKDLKQGSHRDPLWVFDYRFGPHDIIFGADEVMIETADHRRHMVERAKAPQTIPLGQLDAQRAEEPVD
jgi:hypothetical protein